MKNPTVIRICFLLTVLVLAFSVFLSLPAGAEGLADGLVHKAYIFPEADGSYALDEPFTRRQAARMFEALLVPVETESAVFADFDETDEGYAGATLMRAYGMADGKYFFPKRAVTRADLFRWLSCCFPPAEGEDPALQLAVQRGWMDPETEAPEDVLTLRDVLFLMNRVLERETAIEDFPAEAYASAVDYLDDPALFAALVEAGVTHTCASLQPEQWEDCTVLRHLEEGARFQGNLLYWVGADGLFVVGREENGLLFDEKGQYTSGDPELDALVLQVLDEILTGDMTQYKKLRVVYDYTLCQLNYGGSSVYDKGTDDWWQAAARKMLTVKIGNCYSFAAAFCALSRPLGYNTKVTSGSSFRQGVHGWAYIMFDGEEHIFDPQSEKIYQLGNMFDMPPARWAWIEYDPVYTGEEKTADADSAESRG